MDALSRSQAIQKQTAYPPSRLPYPMALNAPTRPPRSAREAYDRSLSREFDGAIAHSDWPREVFLYPSIARPPLAQTFVEQAKKSLSAAASFQTVLTRKIDANREGRILYVAGVELVTGGNGEALIAGGDLTWELRINGSRPEDIGSWPGIWSTLREPREILVHLERDDLIELSVLVPAGANRTIIGMVQGWTAPIIGGGAAASGYVI